MELKHLKKYAGYGIQFVPGGYSLVNYLHDRKIHEKIGDTTDSVWKNSNITNFLVETGRLAGGVGLTVGFGGKVGLASYVLSTAVYIFISKDSRKSLLESTDLETMIDGQAN